MSGCDTCALPHTHDTLWQWASGIEIPGCSEPPAVWRITRCALTVIPDKIASKLLSSSRQHQRCRLLGLSALEKNRQNPYSPIREDLKYLRQARNIYPLTPVTREEKMRWQRNFLALAQAYSWRRMPWEQLCRAETKTSYREMLDPEINRARMAIYAISEVAKIAFQRIRQLAEFLPDTSTSCDLIKANVRAFGQEEDKVGQRLEYNALEQTLHQAEQLHVVCQHVWKELASTEAQTPQRQVFEQLRQQIVVLNNGYLIDAVNYYRRGILIGLFYEGRALPDFLQIPGVARQAEECMMRAYRSYAATAAILDKRIAISQPEDSHTVQQRLKDRRALCKSAMENVIKYMLGRKFHTSSQAAAFLRKEAPQYGMEYTEKPLHAPLRIDGDPHDSPREDFPQEDFRYLTQRDMPHSAIALLREFLLKYPSDSYALCQLARLCTLTRRFDEAMEVYQEAMHHRELPEVAWLELIKVCLHNKQKEQALVFASQLMGKDSQNPDILRRLGDVFRDRHDSGRALECYRSCLEKQPGDLNAKDALWAVAIQEADKLYTAEKYAEAAALYREAFDTHPHHFHSSLNNWIITLCKLEKYQSAVDRYDIMCRNMRRDSAKFSIWATPFVKVASSARQEERYDDMVKLLHRAYKHRPQRPYAATALSTCFLNEARSLKEAAQRDSQVKIYRRQVLEIGCRQELFPTPKILYVLTKAYIDEKNWKSALATLERIGSWRNNAKANFLRARIAFGMGQNQEPYLIDASRLKPDSDLYRQALEQYYRTIGRRRHASAIRLQRAT